MNKYLLYQLVLAYFMLVKSSRGQLLWDSTVNSLETIETIDGQKQLENKKPKEPPIEFKRYKHVALLNEYPYHVAFVKKPENIVLCQGAIIDSEWILTAGTCFIKYIGLKDSIRLVAGVKNIEDPKAIIRSISRAVYYPNFHPFSGVNDLALIKLSTSLNIDDDDLNDQLETVDLSSINYLPGTKCDYSSFENSTLYGFTLKLLDLSKCGVIPDDLDQELKYNCIGLSDQQFITKNKMDSIFGHVGTPLVCDDELYGIKTRDGLFTEVNKIKPWVKKVLKVFS